MRSKLVTPPVSEPVSLDEAKDHLRVSITEDDAYITRLITAARQAVEVRAKGVFLTSEWLTAWRHFPGRQSYPGVDLYYGGGAYPVRQESFELWLPKLPVQSVNSVKYIDTSGTLVTLDEGDYHVALDGDGPALVTPSLARNIWPVTAPYPDAVQVSYTCGFASADDVPVCAKQAVLMVLGTYYENREETVLGNVPHGMEGVVDGLLGLLEWGAYS